MKEQIYHLRRQIFLLILIVAGAISLNAQVTVSSGTTLSIASGTQVTSAGYFTTSGAITNGGIINVAGDITNNGTAAIGGTVVLNGTVAQNINGTSAFTNLTVNNTSAAGVTIAGTNNRVEGVLTLTDGYVNLGNNNLTLGTGASVVSPSVNSMVVINGTGELRREVNASLLNTTLDFPLGEVTSASEYTPVTMKFNSGTFGAGAYAAVKVTDGVYPDPNIAVDYLTRYWDLSQSGITSYNCDATFKYDDATDKVGNEANIYTVKINPSPVITYNLTNPATDLLSATGLTGFGTFTGMRAAQTVSLTGLLEGPYSTASHLMSTNLPSLGLGDPIDYTKFPNTSPFGTGETLSSIPANTVDWIKVELRQGTNVSDAINATSLSAKSGLLLNDGSIVSTDGSSPIRFDNAAIQAGNNLYVIIKHRNHIGVIGSNPAFKGTNGVFNYNFKTGDGTQIYGSAKVEVESGVWALMAGDGDQDFSVQGSDFVLWNTYAGQSTIYGVGDYDMDKQMQGSDFVKWNTNAGKSGANVH